MFIINAMPITYINNVVCESAGIGINPYETNNIVDLGYWGLIYFMNRLAARQPNTIVNIFSAEPPGVLPPYTA